MGWAAYNFVRTRTTDKTEIGNIIIYVPKFTAQFNLGDSRDITLSKLLEFPEFPIEASVLVGTDEMYEKTLNFGFKHVINALSYTGETWTLDNGSYVSFILSGDGRVRLLFTPGSNTEPGIDSLLFFPAIMEGDNNQWIMARYGFYHSDTSLDATSSLVPEERYPYEGFDFYKDATPLWVTDDPYEGGGNSGAGGGTGTFDGTGDSVDIPSLPTLSAVNAGFITLFNPTLGEMSELSSYMWSDLFDLNGWKKIFADPMNAILGLSIVPVAVPNGGTREVKVGNLSTGVSMTVAGSQYVSVDCGSLDIKEYWGAYLDYSPYTKAELYLPYIGIRPISIDDIMNKTVHIVYHVDILSGSCCAYVKCGSSVLYSFIGQCSSSIPITGDNWTNVVNGAISIAGAIGSMVATQGATAPMGVASIASTVTNVIKPNVEKSGAMSGTGGMLGVQTPYLIVTRPKQALPANQNAFTGYPAFITKKLSDITGYTEVESIHLENVPATSDELSEIESVLKRGVIF